MGEKVGHVMCEVNRGQGGVSNYGETDCEERHTCLCVCVCVCVRTTEKVHMDPHRLTDSQPTEVSLAECE